MLGIIIAAGVTVLAAFGAAWFGARLQRKWTPDPIPALKNLAGQIEELSHHVDAIEQERAEAGYFTLGIRLAEGHSNRYTLGLWNDAADDVSVETIQLFFGNGAPLSDCSRPADWLIPANGRKQVVWSPEHDPIMTLKTSGLTPQQFPVPYYFVLGCRINGKPRTVRKNLSFTCRDNRLTQWGP